MGFLDDIKKNVENAVEGVKENVQDALHHRQHQDDTTAQAASAPAPAAELTPAETATMDAPTPAPVAEGPTEEVPTAQAAAEAPGAAPAAQTAEAPREIVVESGDTLSGIAAQFGVDRDALIAANAETLPNPDAIYPGQILRLP
ncbi:hypothetical protein GCM10012320_32220 [Sinomonas cellulolyticus]|uniref:LysM peptidoglycan-binding domain-containing protein n=1 Tax=Sinomonas cellulolyticus TaxID=2801916 RepID=A0ABS1JXY3_9MICC|nr:MULTISPECIES: LysM domain-containing protein [Sinomonas]MBL0704250.1 LysM peptidoglycan-binding domain-containing protein [Sinomonas cellulolyticus]GHG58535.1 hypothetical protein GCM10012320_32220 [Sinomonas sp. KCTC 49339]